MTHLGRPAQLEALAAERRPVLQHAVGHELSVVLVGRHHVGEVALGLGHAAERADDVVGLVAVDFYHRDAVGREYLLDVRDGGGDVLGLLLALRLVLGVGLMAESAALGVEAGGNVAGVLLFQNLLQRVAESEDGRGVQSGRCKARRAEHGIVSAIYERVRVQQKQFLFHTANFGFKIRNKK